MKIIGTKTEVKAVEVEINPCAVLEQLERKWICGIPGRSMDHIWNERWEETCHTSHSWDLDKGALSEEELKIHRAFKTIREVVKTLK